MGKLIGSAPLPLLLTLALGLGLLASGCFSPSYSGEGAYEPPPDAAALLSEAADNLRELQSFKFELTHRRGSIYYADGSGFNVKATDIAGKWSARAGASLDIDTYLVRNHEVPAESGTYAGLKMVLTGGHLYITDPLSGRWVRTSEQMAIIPIGLLAEVMAGLVNAVATPSIEGLDEMGQAGAWKVAGVVKADDLTWLTLDTGDDARARVLIWIDREERIPVKAELIGAVGPYDDPGTVRELRLKDFNEPVRIKAPTDFIDSR